MTLPTGINSSCSNGCTLLSFNNLFSLELQVVDSFNIDDTITIDINNCTAWTDFILTPFPSPVIFSPYNLNLYCVGDSGLNNITACDSYTWIDGITYTASNNTATHTLSNAVGCDSVFTLDLTINNSSSATDLITACDSLTWIDGVTYTNSNNTATYNLTNAVGCDSLVTIDLIINNSSTGSDVITAIDSLTWIDGVTYKNSNNTATYNLTNAIGCDSLVTIDLIIKSSRSETDVQTSRNSITWIDGALIVLILMTLLPLI
jgi:PDZ domain-containing secreted protein